MSTIYTTTVLESLRYPGQSRIDRGSDGLLYFMKVSGSNIDIYYSVNEGANWANYGAPLLVPGLIEASGMFIDRDDNIHICYRVYESTQDKVFYRRLRAGEGTWDFDKLVSATPAGTAGASYTGMDMVAFKLATIWYLFFAIGTHNGTNSGVSLFAATINSNNTYTVKNNLIDGYRQWLNGPDGVVHPAIDFKHTGNGKDVGSGPAIWVTWGRSNLYCIKASWMSGPRWYGPWYPTLISSINANQDSNSGRYNGYGDKFCIPYPNNSTVTVVERRVDDSGGSARTTPTHPQGAVRNCAISVNASSNSYRVYAVGTTTDDLYFIDYTSASGTWGTWTIVTATDVVGSAPNNYTVRRTNSGNGQYNIGIAGGSSPYTITHTSSTAASAPHNPVILTPTNGSARDTTATLPFTWSFTDDDPLDSVSAYAFKRVIGGVTTYWNASTVSWGGSEVYNTTGTNAVTLPASWGSYSDPAHSYSVKVKDQAGLASGYSNTAQVAPSLKSNPHITSPGSTVGTPQITVAWSVVSQSAYRLSLLESGTQVADTDWVTSTASSAPLEYQLQNGITYTAQITTRNLEGLTSSTAIQGFTVVFTSPHNPDSIELLPSTVLGGITVAIENGTPTGSQPALASQALYRRVVGTNNEGILIASGLANNATYFDYTVASDVEYEYQVLLFGVNGTTRYSGWVA